jgi:hypothetical protein
MNSIAVARADYWISRLPPKEEIVGSSQSRRLQPERIHAWALFSCDQPNVEPWRQCGQTKQWPALPTRIGQCPGVEADDGLLFYQLYRRQLNKVGGMCSILQPEHRACVAKRSLGDIEHARPPHALYLFHGLRSTAESRPQRLLVVECHQAH